MGVLYGRWRVPVSVLALGCLLLLSRGQVRGEHVRRTGNYLIVTAPAFAGSAPLTTFAAARLAAGFNVTIYPAPLGATNEDVRTYIVSWYDPGRESYVLLVGDSEEGAPPVTATTIPHWLGGGWHGSVTDLPYACLDGGDDWYPDVYLGRFSVDTVAELQTLVDKTLCVEAGNFSDPDYVKRAAFLSCDSTSAGGEETHEWVIANYFDPAGYDSTRIYASQGGDTADVAAAISQGSLFATYFGHSGFGGWWDPAFDSDDVLVLTNDGLYGLVFSVSCGTARFDWAYGECFGEVWARKPDGGSAAYLATTDLIWSAPSSAWESVRRLEKYFFESFFVDDVWEVGPAWQAALYRLLADPDYGPTHDHTRDYFEMFALLGDPALLLPTEAGPEGDFDNDGDVDLKDLAAFQCCYGQQAVGRCAEGDLAGDTMIDLEDYTTFVAGFAGPVIPREP